MKREYIKRIKSRKALAYFVSILLILSFISAIAANTPLVMARSDQDTATEQAGGSEYQTVGSFPGEDKTETETPDGTMPVKEVGVKSLDEYTGSGTTGEQEPDPDNPPAVTQNETVGLNAGPDSCVYAVFYGQYDDRTGTFPILATRRGRLVQNETASESEAEFDLDDLTAVYDDDEKEEGAPPSMRFAGWTTEPVRDNTAGAATDILQSPCTFKVSEDPEDRVVRLYPVFEPIRWLEFDTNGSGAAYIAPESFPENEGFVFDNPLPVRSGYTFQGWYTEKEGGTQVTDAAQNIISAVNTSALEVRNGRLFIKEPYLQVKLYAHWAPGDSQYTVLIWKQKGTDDWDAAEKSYDLAESFSVPAVTDSTASVSDRYKELAEKNSINCRSEYQGFSYRDCSGDKTVTGDGKTVLDVYYDRNVHTFTFKSEDAVIHTVKGLYGSDISGIWRFTGTDGIAYPRTDTCTSWQPSGSAAYTAGITQMLMMPDEDITFTHTSTDGTKGYFHYYVEALPGAENTRTFSGKEFVPYNENTETVEGDLGTIDHEADFFLIEGFERLQAATADGNTVAAGSDTSWDSPGKNDIYFYYLRSSYTVEFVDTNDNSMILDESVLYQDSLEDKVPAVPDPPEGYRFTGWYADPGCTTAVFFHEPTQAEIDAVTDKDGDARYQVYDRMPAGALRIYAGWETIRDKIGLDPDGGEQSSAQSTFIREPDNGDPVGEYSNASGENEEIGTAKTVSDAGGGNVTDPGSAVLPDNAGQAADGVQPADDPLYDDGLTDKYSESETQSDILDNPAFRPSGGTDADETDDTDAAFIDNNTEARLKKTSPAPVTGVGKQSKTREVKGRSASPIPVTGFGEQTAPYIVVPAIILIAAVLVFICRKKGGKQNESSSL